MASRGVPKQRPRARRSQRSTDTPAPVAESHSVVSSELVADMASKWEKYPSINDVDLEQVDKIRRAVQGSSVEFVALEKVHGSNFAFETNGSSISYFSRNKRLSLDEKFVGRTTPYDAMRKYHGAVMELFRLCSAERQNVCNVIVYGEYFGGWYPHKDVRQEGPGAGAPVQKGIVAYAPAHHFFAFDIAIDGIFLDFDECQDYLQRAGFPLIVTPVVRGTFDECMSFDVETFATTIPNLLALPLCTNYAIAEGLIIRPVRRQDKWTVKRKSVRYLEANLPELRKWLNKCVESKEAGFTGLYLSLCQAPRLDSVLSKDPQLRDSGFKALHRIQTLYRMDVQEAFLEKIRASGLEPPQEGLEVAQREADKRVVEWLGYSDEMVLSNL